MTDKYIWHSATITIVAAIIGAWITNDALFQSNLCQFRLDATRELFKTMFSYQNHVINEMYAPDICYTNMGSQYFQALERKSKKVITDTNLLMQLEQEKKQQLAMNIDVQGKFLLYKQGITPANNKNANQILQRLTSSFNQFAEATDNYFYCDKYPDYDALNASTNRFSSEISNINSSCFEKTILQKVIDAFKLLLNFLPFIIVVFIASITIKLIGYNKK